MPVVKPEPFVFVVCYLSAFPRSITGTNSNAPPFGLVRDGTPCGDNLICVNQTCVSIFPYIDQTKCPTNQHNVECYGNGVSSGHRDRDPSS